MADLYEQLKQQQLAIATKRIVRRQLSPGTTVLSAGGGSAGATPGTTGGTASEAGTAGTNTQTFLVSGEAGILRTTTPPFSGSPPWPPDFQNAPTSSATSYGANKIKYIGGDGGASYWVSVILLSFDTSVLPDTASVIGASLKLVSGGTYNTDNRALMADWHVWTPVQADWTELGVSGAISGVPISMIPADGPFEIQLENAPANVSKTGLTYLRLTINGGAPTSANRVTIWGLGHETGVEEDGTPNPNTAARLTVSYV